MTIAIRRALGITPKSLATLSAIAVLAMPGALEAQGQHGSGDAHTQSLAQSQSLEERLNALQEQVAILESALKRGHKSGPASASAGSGGMQMGAGAAPSGASGTSRSGMGGWAT